MAEPRRKPEGEPVASPAAQPAKAHLAVAREGDQPSLSPALELQEQLMAAWNEARRLDDGRRWSTRSTLLFTGGVSTALWGGIAAAAWALWRVLAR